MSVSSAGVTGDARAGGGSATGSLRAYFWSDNPRRVQTVLGLIWLLDAGLQFQSFMYSHAFPAVIVGLAQGQPGWVHDSMIWAAKIANGNLGIWNTLFALTQLVIGVGILYRPTVKPALALSFAWALFVWWFGEGFGMMLMNMAQPMTGAPGGVLMYALIGLVVWPNGRSGGLLGVRGAKIMWAALWLVMAWLWLMEPSSSANATSSALTAMPAGIGFLNSLQNSLAGDFAGGGLAIALFFSALSAAIAITPLIGWQARRFIALSMIINVAFWVLTQSFGGILDGGATDPNSGPLFVLLACAMLPLVSETGAEKR